MNNNQINLSDNINLSNNRDKNVVNDYRITGTVNLLNKIAYLILTIIKIGKVF